MDFVEDNLVRVTDAPKPGYKGEGGDDDEDGFEVTFGVGRGLCGRSFHQLIQLNIGRGAILGFFRRGTDIPLT